VLTVATDGKDLNSWGRGADMHEVTPLRPLIPTRRWAALLAPLAVVMTACVAPAPAPAPTTTTTTTTSAPVSGSPVIASFSATPSTATSPALIAFSWSVSDPEGQPVTCSIDGNGDNVVDIVVTNCEAGGSRNLTLTSSATARLTASDGTTSSVATRSITVTTGSTETFDIVLRPTSTLSTSAQDAFDAAEARWESILVRGIPDVSVNLGAGACLADAAPFSGIVDDLVIDVAVVPIDGAGGVLGRAGPCLIGNSDGLSRWGVMEFDKADVANLAANGRLGDVILHEMAHVLGVGTLWGPGLLTGGGGADPVFTGARTAAVWSSYGRVGPVPVENTGGAGTRDSHWRESTFASELMTGWLNNGANPLSVMTIASLADLGYRVSTTPADPYSPPMVAALQFFAALRHDDHDDHDDHEIGHTEPVFPIGTV
jgi:hypothetical protein